MTGRVSINLAVGVQFWDHWFDWGLAYWEAQALSSLTKI
jgi:hypothetical protein